MEKELCFLSTNLFLERKVLSKELCVFSFSTGFLFYEKYRAAMGYARYGRSIANGKLVEKLLGLIEKLKETKGMRIFKFRRGFEKAVEMLEKGEEKGVFVWAPSLKKWLKDPDYVFWLGMER